MPGCLILCICFRMKFLRVLDSTVVMLQSIRILHATRLTHQQLQCYIVSLSKFRNNFLLLAVFPSTHLLLGQNNILPSLHAVSIVAHPLHSCLRTLSLSRCLCYQYQHHCFGSRRFGPFAHFRGQFLVLQQQCVSCRHQVINQSHTCHCVALVHLNDA